jgi:hypothetical protein
MVPMIFLDYWNELVKIGVCTGNTRETPVPLNLTFFEPNLVLVGKDIASSEIFRPCAGVCVIPVVKAACRSIRLN